MEKLVSVIIPTYNRAHLIAETLHSIMSQTYQNWECVVIDDASEDSTLEVLGIYFQKDSRIKFHQRPKLFRKGANSCRNFGFKKCSGDFIIWFDSDDLMTPSHIESKLKLIEENQLDFVVSRTQNFEDDKFLEPYKYNKKEYGINASDFILLKIHWYTYDVMLRREIAEKISWNENMKSWQDYNYFCKMLLITENAAYLDKILTHRRLHNNSIQKNMTRTSGNFREELLENRLFTFMDIQKAIDDNIKRELIYGLMNLCFEIGRSGAFPKLITPVAKIVEKNLGKISRINFILSVFLARWLKKGNFLLEIAKSRKYFINSCSHSL